jgi:hypothetical protein
MKFSWSIETVLCLVFKRTGVRVLMRMKYHAGVPHGAIAEVVQNAVE